MTEVHFDEALFSSLAGKVAIVTGIFATSRIL